MTEGRLHIDQVKTPHGGVIGMTHCPGRQGVDGDDHVWERELDQDLLAIKAWRADAVITLLQCHEFEKLGVAGLGQAVRAQGLRWYHLPIVDMGAPAAEFITAFEATGGEILDCLERESSAPGRIILHCAAGLGRTGTVAASFLVHYGMSPQLAITTVRATRPGTIETSVQEQFVRNATVGNLSLGASSSC